MASLSVGSNNFPTRVYENPPDLVDWLAAEMETHDVTPEIECFDLSHIFKAHDMWQTGQLKARPYVQFVHGREERDARRPGRLRLHDRHGETAVRRRCALVRGRDRPGADRA